MAQAQAIDAAGAALYGELSASGANNVFSPASVAIALEIAMSGARGETAAEIARFLQLTGLRPSPTSRVVVAGLGG